MRGTVPGVGKARFQVTTSSRNLHLVGTLAKNGAKFEYIEFNGVHYDRDPATGCWKADPKKAVEDESFITLPGATVGKPRRTGRHLVTVRVREVDDEVTTVDYRIDTRTSFIVGARFVGGSSQTKGVVFSAHALKRAPRLVNPTTNPCPTAPAAQDPPVNS